jgi:hypothetical protein
MLHSRIIDLVYAILPAKLCKNHVIGRHVDHCPACQAKLAQKEEVRSLFVQADEVSGLDYMWPAIQQKLDKSKVKEGTVQFFAKPAKQWAATAAALMLVALVGFWLFRNYKPKGIPITEEAQGFKLDYLKIENQPARIFLFQPQDSNIVIVWAEKNT